MVIGLTGEYCAGKNTAASCLEARGWTCIDVDKLGHEAIDASRDAIIARFGAGILDPDGEIDRRALSRIIFSDPKALSDQEAIIHPVAIRILDERIEDAESEARMLGGEARICINAALLHRTERIASCALIIEVRAPFILRLARGMRRDAASMRVTMQRMLRQLGFRSALRIAASRAGRPIAVLWNCMGRRRLERGIGVILSGLSAG